MTVREIIAGWLKEHGYDGLCSTDYPPYGCGCDIDDLSPCDCFDNSHCVPAYKSIATQEDKNNDFGGRIGDTIYTAEKREKEGET